MLIVAPFSEYSVFYHRLTIDREGRLFLSYDYWSTYWFYRTDHFGSRRALLMSPDGGDAWKLVEHRISGRPGYPAPARGTTFSWGISTVPCSKSSAVGLSVRL